MFRQVTCVKWITSHTSAGVVKKLVCGTADGVITCLDTGGRLVAAARVLSMASDPSARTSIGVRCLDVEGEMIFGGCEDGSLRVWKPHDDRPGTLVELYAHASAHQNGFGAICVNNENNTIVTGGDDGRIRIWKFETY
jgi:WD40 repeat protein